VEKREEEEEVVESIEIREDRTLTKQLRQVRVQPALLQKPGARSMAGGWELGTCQGRTQDDLVLHPLASCKCSCELCFDLICCCCRQRAMARVTSC
jgi:hypothetical protein